MHSFAGLLVELFRANNVVALESFLKKNQAIIDKLPEVTKPEETSHYAKCTRAMQTFTAGVIDVLRGHAASGVALIRRTRRVPAAHEHPDVRSNGRTRPVRPHCSTQRPRTAQRRLKRPGNPGQTRALAVVCKQSRALKRICRSEGGFWQRRVESGADLGDPNRGAGGTPRPPRGGVFLL
eukprot:m.324417 g.324417  ORF g.324417 m.324417 type:complete len:180 (+) comp16462_c0_seq3:3145-3684(+)